VIVDIEFMIYENDMKNLSGPKADHWLSAAIPNSQETGILANGPWYCRRNGVSVNLLGAKPMPGGLHDG